MKKLLLILITFFIAMNVQAKDIRYLNLTKSTSIIITIADGSISAKSNQGYDIEINDLGIYQNVFMGSDSNYYPLYIIYDNNGYSFSDFKKEISTDVYIRSDKMLSVVTKNAQANITNCESMLGVSFINLLKNNIFKMIYMLIPIVLIVYSTYDFATLAMIDKKEGLGDAFSKFLKRVIATILIFLVPNILIFLTSILGTDELQTCLNTFSNMKNVQNISE